MTTPVGVEARLNSAKLILRKIKSLNGQKLPVILTGDFNATPAYDPYKLISAQLQDAKTADKAMNMGPDGTFNNFSDEKPATERIDFIFTGYGAKAVNYGVLRESHDGKFASDHYPVVAGIECGTK